MERYAKNAGAVFSLKLHIVWCPKYRRPVLEGVVAKRLKQLLKEKTKELGLVIHTLGIMPDHVHLFLEHEPQGCVAEIVNSLKGYTRRVLRNEFPSLRSRLPTLWSRSYYAGSIGYVSEATVRKYIESQKGK
jgi:REP-associated tyrosine transposase